MDENMDIQQTKILLDYKCGRYQQATKRYTNLLSSIGLDHEISLIDQSDRLSESQASLLIFELLFLVKANNSLSEKQLWRYVDCVSLFDPDDVICQGAIYNLVLVLFIRHNNIGAAFEFAKLALDAYQRCGSNYLQLFVHMHIAFIHVYAGRLLEAKTALDEAQQQLALCGTPVCENAMIEITRLWIRAEAQNVLPGPEVLAPLSEEITSGEFWPETFLVLVALQFRAAMYQENERMLEQHSGYEVTLRSRGLVQLLPAMQLLREEYLFEGKGSSSKLFNLPERQIVLLLPTLNTWQLNIGEAPSSVPRLDRIRATDELHQAKQKHKMGRFDVTMKHFTSAMSIIEEQGWRFLLSSEYEFVSEICRECRQRGRFVNLARHLQTSLLAGQKPRHTGLDNGVSMGFTISEVGILSRLSEATSNKALAIDLGVSESTVKYHLKNIYRKLSVHNRRDAIKAATFKGLIA